MDIKADQNGKVRVQFDSFDERFDFGCAAPLTSIERYRALNYTTWGVLTARLIKPYSAEEADYPQTITTSFKTLGAVAGRLLVEAGSPDITEEYRQASQQMLATITNFFEGRTSLIHQD